MPDIADILFAPDYKHIKAVENKQAFHRNNDRIWREFEEDQERKRSAEEILYDAYKETHDICQSS